MSGANDNAAAPRSRVPAVLALCVVLMWATTFVLSFALSGALVR